MNRQRFVQVACLLIGIALGCPRPLRAQEVCTLERLGDCSDVVAVGYSRAKIVLATPKDGHAWRHRSLVFPAEAPAIADVALAFTGTKLAVLFSGGRHEVLDLTLPVDPQAEATHHVPGQTYRLRGTGGFILLDDWNRETALEGSVTPEVSSPAGAQASLGRLEGTETLIWKFYRLEPAPYLYAPVLEFAPGETVFPSETGIWQTLLKPRPTSLPSWERRGKRAASPRGVEERAALANYRELPDKERFGAVYCRIRSYPGSWLYEYWTYYAFDTGNTHPHPHDTEHVFVEVDKIGGRVLGVLAAGHADTVPNNLYSSLLPGAKGATLPLFVMVEKDKHALAPDINRDRKFTAGLDVNLASRNSQVWGVRDSFGVDDAHEIGYNPILTLNRSLENAWAPEGFHDYFPPSEFAPVKALYRLVSFPESFGAAERPRAACSVEHLSQACGESLLAHHPDARAPAHIYKPWVFPFRQVRIGYANFENRDLASVSFVTDMRHLPGLSRFFELPVPGQLAFELFTGRTKEPFSEITQVSPTLEVRQRDVSGVRFYYGVQYEQAVTPMLGFFTGYFTRTDHFGLHCQISCTSLQPNGNIFQPGVYFSWPKVPRLGLHNATFHVGPVFARPGGYDGVYVRFTTSLWRSRGRTRFGNPPEP